MITLAGERLTRGCVADVQIHAAERNVDPRSTGQKRMADLYALLGGRLLRLNSGRSEPIQ